jgi:hypothetical protein
MDRARSYIDIFGVDGVIDLGVEGRETGESRNDEGVEINGGGIEGIGGGIKGGGWEIRIGEEHFEAVVNGVVSRASSL